MRSPTSLRFQLRLGKRVYRAVVQSTKAGTNLQRISKSGYEGSLDSCCLSFALRATAQQEGFYYLAHTKPGLRLPAAGLIQTTCYYIHKAFEEAWHFCPADLVEKMEKLIMSFDRIKTHTI